MADDSPPSAVALIVPDGVNPDSFVPEIESGELTPNFYCRQRTGSRFADGIYCRNTAGFRTTHKGEGPCFQHGGTVYAGPLDSTPTDDRRELRRAAIERLHVLKDQADDTALPARDRRQAIETMFRFGLGTSDHLTVVSPDVVARLQTQAQRFVDELTPEALAIVRRITDEVWR